MGHEDTGLLEGALVEQDMYPLAGSESSRPVDLLYSFPSSAEEGLFAFFLQIVVLILTVLQFILLPRGRSRLLRGVGVPISDPNILLKGT